MDHQHYTPGPPFSENERDWQAQVGLLPWSSAVVFTKESLVKFLKQLEVEVDPNMSQLKKLPKYARCGSLSAAGNEAAVPALVDKPSADDQSCNANARRESKPSSPSAFVPTRKVRQQPGGGSSQIASLLAGEPEIDLREGSPSSVNARATTPSSHPHTDLNSGCTPSAPAEASAKENWAQVVLPDGSAFVPSRKVREPTGGFSTMASILSGN